MSATFWTGVVVGAVGVVVLQTAVALVIAYGSSKPMTKRARTSR